MRRSLVLLLLAWLAWSAAHPPAHAEDESETVRDLRAELTETNARVARLEQRVATLEATHAALVVEDRPSTSPTTLVYTLHRTYMERKLYEHTSRQVGPKLEGKSDKEKGQLLDDLFASVQKQLRSFEVRLELREDRSALVVEKTKGGTTIRRGIWSRIGDKIILTLTHRNAVRETTPDLVEIRDLGDTLELPAGNLPFPIRVRKEP